MAEEQEQDVACTVVAFTVTLHVYGVAEKMFEAIVKAQDVVDRFPTEDKNPVCDVIAEDASQFISAPSNL